MRIALLTHQWPGVRLGGIGAYTVHAARGLGKLGHEVHVFTFTLPAAGGGQGGVPAMRGVTVHEVGTMAEQVMGGGMTAEMGMALQVGGEGMYRLGLGWLLCEALLKVHAERPFDVVEGPEYEALGLPLVLGDFGGTVVTQLHSGSAIGRMVGNIGGAEGAGDQALKELLELAVIAGADGACAPSRQAIVDTRLAYGREDLAEAAEAIALPFEASAQEFEAPPREGAVLYIGRLEWLKGAHVLVGAANEFLRKHAGARVRVVGPDTMTAPDGGGSMLAWMKAHLAEGAASRVTFLGEQNKAQMAQELRECAFVVVPSLSETYSYVCCEAMAAGRAVVVSDGIGAAEVVGEGGVRFKKGDAADLARLMGDVWEDVGLRERLSRAAWERARGALSGDAVMAKRVAFYQRVIARGRGKGRERLRETLGSRAAQVEGIVAALRTADARTLMEFADAVAPGRPETPGMKLVNVLAARGGNRERVRFFLYGAGRHTTRLLVEKPRWEAQGHTLVGIIDDHPRFRETPEYLGLPVQSCAAAAERLGAGDVVILSTDAMEEQFWNQTAALRARGVAVFRLYGR